MDPQRSRPAWPRDVLLVAAALGLLAAGCGRGSPARESAAAAGDCRAGVEWPAWPGALPDDLPVAERELFRAAWPDGPNFACTALLVRRGCGTGCASGLVHDARTGVTRRLPFAIHRHPGTDAPLLAWRADAPVVRATGWRNEVERGVFRYRWDGERLRRLRD